MINAGWYKFISAYQSGTIRQFRLSDMAVVATFDAPTFSDVTGGAGNALKVSADGQFVSVLRQSDTDTANQSLTVIDLTSRNETFKGTAGADTFAGGLGDDTYTVNNAGDTITERINGGNDTVLATLSHTLAAHVEVLKLGGRAALNGTGNTLGNTLIGNAGVNTLDGGRGDDRLVGTGGGDTLIGDQGNDTLESGRGIDTLIGGAGNDTYLINDSGDVIQEDAAGGIDTVQVAASYVLAGTLENLVLRGKAASGTGNAQNNTITGNLLANMLDGGDGNDTLFGMVGSDTLLGGAGGDTLDGGTGADTMTGGTGNDTYLVDHARDTTIEAATGGGNDTVVASLNWKLADGLENLTLAPGTGPLSGTGNAIANVMTGNAGNNRLDGGLGADRMSGGAGDDTYVVDTRLDRVTEAVNAGTDTVLTALTWKLGANVENLTLQGTGAINGTGNGLANVITGNAGDNVLDGGGADFGFDRDTLIGGAGNDTYIVTPFYQFTIVEQSGQGTDRCLTAVSFDGLPDHVENLVLTGTDNISGGGNALANTVTGNAGNNILYGYDGIDTLIGGAGNDTLDGGAGNDTLEGGIGNDAYIVNDAADRVIEKAGEGRDVVNTVITLTIPDEIEVLALELGSDINATGSSRSDTLVGNSGANTLDGKAGNDVLIDNGFNDTLIGGSGADYFLFGTFRPGSISGSSATITDFSSTEDDLISLIYTDANPATPDFEPMTFIGTRAFSGAGGEVRYQQTGANTFVTGDIDGDKAADFTIELKGLITLAQSDFEFTL